MKKLAFLLIPLFGLIFTSNSFALQHNYDSFMTVENLYIPPVTRDSNSLLYRDFSATDYDGSTADSWLQMTFPTSFNAQFYPYSNQASYFLTTKFGQMSYADGKCNIQRYSGSPAKYSIRSTWVRSTGTTLGSPYNNFSLYGRGLFVGGGFNPVSYSSESITGDTFKCYTSQHAPYNYVDSLYVGSYFNVTNFVNNTSAQGSNPLPDNRVQSYNGVSLSQSDVHSSSGITYTSSFSFSKLFNGPDNYIPYVRSLSIPLMDSQGYFLKYHNLTSGRQFEWHFNFDFTGSFEHPSVMTNTYARVVLYGLPRNASRIDGYIETSFNCTEVVTSFVNDDGITGHDVDYTCPVTLDTDYSDFKSVRFMIGNSNDDYFFSTDSKWNFSSAYLVSDNDYTQGDSFNTDINGNIWGINNGEPTGESDISWFDSFINLFNFSIPSQPLGLVLGGFTNQESCASIPIIAGMIHSNETQVCPWFSAETRAITTPVLTLFSGFLVFGFIIHWLGSSSGNFLEDSGTHGDGSIKVGKRGK